MLRIIKNKAELSAILKKEIDQSKGKVGILAGHFALMHKGRRGELIPAISQELKDEVQAEAVMNHPYIGHFPIETWKLGVSLGKHARENGIELGFIILVNDWQWVDKAGFGENNPHREEFYSKAELPLSFTLELKNVGLNEEMVLPFRTKDGRINNKFFFSEQKLRNQFDNYYADTCDVENQCAREFIPLLLQLRQEGIKVLINFIPKTCMAPINDASEKTIELFGADMRIVNVFVSGVFKNDFWEAAEVHSF
jgi:hypothetical protein